MYNIFKIDSQEEPSKIINTLLTKEEAINFAKTNYKGMPIIVETNTRVEDGDGYIVKNYYFENNYIYILEK